MDQHQTILIIHLIKKELEVYRRKKLSKYRNASSHNCVYAIHISAGISIRLIHKKRHISLLSNSLIEASYSDWSPTFSSVPQGTRVIAAISASNLVSIPCTRVINAFVITAENSSCKIQELYEILTL